MKKCLLFLVTVLALSACSSRFAYNNLDWLVHWYVDDYIDFSTLQKSQFDDHMARWLAWHRQDELAKYQSHLMELKVDIETNNLTLERVQYHFDYGQNHWQRLRDQIMPELAALARDLTDDQVSDMFDTIQRDNKNLQDKYGERTTKESIDKRQSQIRKNLKQWIGKLNSTQQALIDDYANQFVPNNNQWLAQRKQMQARAKSLFSVRKTDAEFEARLVYLMSQPKEYADPIYLENSHANRDTYARMIAALMPSLSPKQKSRLLNEIEGYIEDIALLMEN